MIHTFVGNLGHFFVIASFISALAATYGYVKSVYATDLAEKESWSKYARVVFIAHSVFVVSVVVTLFYIIHNHYFEYHYAYSHTSSILPIYYQVSSFWEGQEGSFLLWIFWNVILGLVLIKTNKTWEAPIMAVFALVQGFLVSMILGAVFFNLKIGSSPFLLLRDVIDAPIFKTDPNFVPQDGSGLNPLLQNYWMVIHPPTLFLGFATTLVPFAYCIAGLWLGKFREWIRPALPWALFSAVVLGVGILMGGYWAYETLNFGGYWNWDPVENAVYVPWIVLIAAIHTMIAFRKSNSALKVSIILVISTFILILYSTFLTRSGILGDSSVHSFTDLGLSGQLLIYLLAFVFISVLLVTISWNKLASDEEETSVYSREFWIFMGAAVFLLMGFHVIFVTSFPVFNTLAESVGIDLSLAPPADAVQSYSNIQLWFAIVLAVLSGTGQFFWWKKIDKQQLKDELLYPVIIALLVSAVAIIVADVNDLGYMLLLTASVYSITANTKILRRVLKSNYKLSGGAIAHIGIAMMLIGILFSSGYSKIISVNNTGLVWHKDFPDEINQKNLLLFQNEPRQMKDYSLTYRGIRKLVDGVPGYVDVHSLEETPDPTRSVVLEDIIIEDKKMHSYGDTVKVMNHETSYFEIEYAKSNGKSFTLYPTVQVNKQMEMTVYSPDISRTAGMDLYTHIRTFPDPEQETEWSETEEHQIQIGQTFIVNDFIAQLKEVKKIDEVRGVQLASEDVAVKAVISISGKNDEYIVEPIYIIKDRMAGRIPDIVHDLGIKISLLNIDPKTGSFTFATNTTQKEWVILEAVEKPLINVLWIGTLIMVLGFVMAIHRRYSEFRKMRDKEDSGELKKMPEVAQV
ncbi:MAG: cytochrome c biogenesis protein CcsA [Cyclobacteriaceae bacterium]